MIGGVGTTFSKLCFCESIVCDVAYLKKAIRNIYIKKIKKLLDGQKEFKGDF
jgi:hypothetical protein